MSSDFKLNEPLTTHLTQGGGGEGTAGATIKHCFLSAVSCVVYADTPTDRNASASVAMTIFIVSFCPLCGRAEFYAFSSHIKWIDYSLGVGNKLYETLTAWWRQVF